jgi:hypothetical protein
VEKTVSVNILEQGRYRLVEYGADAEPEAAALPGFKLDLKSVFSAL